MVFVGQSLAPVNQLIQTTQIGLAIAGAILLILTIAMWRILFSRYIGRPLGRLVAHAQAIGSGNLESRVEIPDRTELTILGETLNNSAIQLGETIRQVESQRDDLGTLYKISDQLARSISPDEGRRRAVELAGSIFASDCLLVAGHFHAESHVFHGTLTYRGEGGEIKEHPYPDEAVKATAPYFDPDIIEQWIRGSLDGETRIRQGSTVAYPLERRGRRLGIILAPGRRAEDSGDGRATAANPDVAQALRKHLTIALELNELQRERLQRERLSAIGATVAGLAHSLKNGLNSLKGGQYIVERSLKTDNPPKLRQGWKMVKRGVHHIERLAQDMLFFTVDRAPDLKPVDPNEILVEILNLLQESAADQGVKIVSDLDEKMQPLVLDRKAIYRAVLNLTSNAIDGCVESDTGDTVILRSLCKLDSVVITVEDNGVGIPEQQVKRVTERFFTTKGSKGTGLGLPVALKIAEDHGGTLEVESVVGEKTSFHFRIPRDTGQPS
jgi:signal transduction histidine kinase